MRLLGKLFWSMILAVGVATASCDGGGEVADAGSDVVSDTGGDVGVVDAAADDLADGPPAVDTADATDGGDLPSSCDPARPEVTPPTPGPEACDLADRTPAACTTGDGQPGLERCTPYEIAEDQTEGRVGPCLQTCTAGELSTSRACSEGGVAGVQFCDTLSGGLGDQQVWQACLLEACIACEPGDTQLCGPGTNYPDSDQTCLISNGIPSWFTGDCST